MANQAFNVYKDGVRYRFYVDSKGKYRAIYPDKKGSINRVKDVEIPRTQYDSALEEYNYNMSIANNI
jgi:hypothetical protein